ncbi:MAG: FAD-dependent oxidoreductase [Deltaproteobacteria bacterium]|nr:FAD-dependent oxidoreductase [Deltaproteobacteria bacterium]
MDSQTSDVTVVGGGFYGSYLALFLRRFFDRVVLLEKEPDLLQRASFLNQARVHMGYHYPRNLVTAYRSFINFPRFLNDFRKAIIKDFVKIYAIARSGSKVNAHRFYTMFKAMKAPIREAPQQYQVLFNEELIENVFLVKEYAFDASVLRRILKERLAQAQVDVCFNSEVNIIEQSDDDLIALKLKDRPDTIKTKHVFICVYSNMNKLLQNSGLPLLPLKHELTEICLVNLPQEYRSIGVTVMDGPFFSTMPFPALGVHSLSHVRYTPHCSWNDQQKFVDGHRLLQEKQFSSNFIFMQRDAQRYLPLLGQAEYKKSLFEIKTVLLNNEIDDGRPILFKEHYGGINNLFVILGGKIDNIYDVIETIAERKKSLNLKDSIVKRFRY